MKLLMTFSPHCMEKIYEIIVNYTQTEDEANLFHKTLGRSVFSQVPDDTRYRPRTQRSEMIQTLAGAVTCQTCVLE
jgi:hypothetical protein